jgi:hypothetical protein
MPKIITEDRMVTALKKGDVIQPEGITVVNVDRKVKWAIVEFPHGAKARWELDRIVSVSREVPTDEEKAQADREYQVRWLNTRHDEWINDPADALTGKIEKARTGKYVELVSHYDLDTFLQTQALYKIAKHVEFDVQRLAERMFDAFTPDELLAASYYEVMKMLTRRYYRRNPLSRSTSVTSNLYEDLDDWALAKVKEDLGYVHEYMFDCYNRVEEYAKSHSTNTD